jgi:hypothetical protein
MRKALYYAQALVVKSHRRRENECPWRETAHIPKIVIISIMQIFGRPCETAAPPVEQGHRDIFYR